MVQSSVCAVGLYTTSAAAFLLPAVRAQRPVYLTRGVVGRLGPTAGCRACVGRGGSHSHECRARLGECLTREAQTHARAEAQAPEEALQPDADVLEELTGQGMEVDDAQAAAQEAQAQARQGPADLPTRSSSGSGAQASSDLKRERLTWMSRESSQPRSEDLIADHRRQMDERVDANCW